MFGAASNRPRLAGQLTDFIRRIGIPFFNTQMGKGTVAGIGTAEGGTELWMGTAALTERDYVHEAIDRADLILAIGHDTIEKPPFIMGPKGPKVIHVGYTPANVEQVYFPHAEVVGDVGPSLALLADRVEGKLPNAGALAAAARGHPRRARWPAPTESRFPLTPQRIVHDVRKVMPADGIVALDNGMYKIWFARCYRTRNANALLARQRAGDDGRRPAVGHDGRAAAPGKPRAGGVRRRRLHDELAGARDRRSAEAQPRRADHPGRRLRHDPLEAGGRQLRRLGPDLRQPRLRQVRRGLRRERAAASSLPMGSSPTLEAAFAEGGVQLVAVPVDYSENSRVLVDELRNRVAATVSRTRMKIRAAVLRRRWALRLPMPTSQAARRSRSRAGAARAAAKC